MVQHHSNRYTCKEAAIQLLSRRDHSEGELCTKLKIKGFPESEISDVIAVCRDLGYLDDTRYAQQKIRHYLSKGHGELKIRHALKQNNIPDEMINVIFQQIDVDWFELAKLTAEKKFTVCFVSDPKDYAKRVRFLQYRGFNFEQIQYALKK